MLVKVFAGVVAIAGLTVAGLGASYVSSPAAKDTPAAAVGCDEGSCQVVAASEACCEDLDCCPECPDCSLCPDCSQCCGGKSSAVEKVAAKTAKSKAADCGDCGSDSSCCAK
jgi:hypothetical protein